MMHMEPNEDRAVREREMDPMAERFDEQRSLARRLVEDENPDPMLRRVAEAVRSATDAVAVNIERFPSPHGTSVAVVTAGPNVASADELNALLKGANRLVISLGRRSERLGSIVIWRHATAQPVTRDQVERIADLADLASLALRTSLLEEKLRRSREEFDRTIDNKHRLITGISEELKNRLGAAAEYVQLLDTEGELNERETRYIERSRKSIDAAVHLLNELVQLSRAETGKLAMHLEPVNVATLIRSAVRDYQLEIGTIGVDFELKLPERLPLVVTDIDSVRQVLDNLLSNAVRYTPAGGRITVQADIRPGRRKADPSKYVCVSVSDTGPGVGDQDLIFEEVYRVERRGGTPGFRLAISRRVARLLGGELSLEPGPEPGSTFTLWLPGSPPAAPASPSAAMATAHADEPELPLQ
jgi:signal transduction histidine kinase